MSDADQVSQALAELWDMVKCCCDGAYTGRGLHDPYCQCDSADAVQTVADHIEALTKERDQHWDSFVHWRKEADDRSEQLAAARRDAEIAEEELGLQEEEACMMEDSYLELKKERDALEAKLAKAEWLLTDAAVQLEEGKIKTRRNRAGLIWQFLAEIKGT